MTSRGGHVAREPEILPSGPIPELEVAATLLNDAADAHLRGEQGLAEELFIRTNEPVVRDWLESVWARIHLGIRLCEWSSILL